MTDKQTIETLTSKTRERFFNLQGPALEAIFPGLSFFYWDVICKNDQFQHLLRDGIVPSFSPRDSPDPSWWYDFSSSKLAHACTGETLGTNWHARMSVAVRARSAPRIKRLLMEADIYLTHPVENYTTSNETLLL